MASEPSDYVIYLQQVGGKRHDTSQGTSELVQLDDGSLELQQLPRHGTERTERGLGLLRKS